MNDPQDRLTIGEFARATGVSRTALRFYGDCDLVTPGQVDPVTGYRYYHRHQVGEVRLIRQLRRAGLPLAEVRRVLADPSVAGQVLHARLMAMEAALREAREAAGAALHLLGESRPGAVALPGSVLADAVRRACASTDRGAGADPGFAALAGVLLEADGHELTVVATDRYRMVTQALPLQQVAAASGWRLVLRASGLESLVPWLRRQPAVQVQPDLPTPDGGPAGQGPWPVGAPLGGAPLGGARLGAPLVGARLVGAGEERRVEGIAADFPDYRLLLDGLTEPATRVVAGRRQLSAAVEGPDPVRWDVHPRFGLRVTRPPDAATQIRVDAEVRGPRAVLGFEAGRLRAVLDAADGPDLVFEISRSDQPVVVRSADLAGVTTLLMPTRLTPTGTTPTGTTPTGPTPTGTGRARGAA